MENCSQKYALWSRSCCPRFILQPTTLAHHALKSCSGRQEMKLKFWRMSRFLYLKNILQGFACGILALRSLNAISHLTPTWIPHHSANPFRFKPIFYCQLTHPSIPSILHVMVVYDIDNISSLQLWPFSPLCDLYSFFSSMSQSQTCISKLWTWPENVVEL